jgi:CRISPR-associated endoribonuclease Cas6
MPPSLFSPSTTLASVVVQVRCLRGDSRPRSFGHAAKRLLLDALASVDLDLADQVEQVTPFKPYTVSPLLEASDGALRENRRPSEGGRGWLRVTALGGSHAPTLLPALEGALLCGMLCEGRQVELDRLPFLVEGCTANAEQHPLAGQGDYASLAWPYWSGGEPAGRRLFLEFFSPAAFKKSNSPDLYVPMPYPELVFGSLMERWNAFSPLKLPEELRQAVREEVVFTWFDLRSAHMDYKNGSTKVGALGRAAYAAPRAGKALRQALGLLADFALYSGAGLMTAQGFGQVRRIPDEAER